MTTGTITIIESGMTFGPFSESEFLHIEASEWYAKIQPNGVKIAEFLLLREKKGAPAVWIVEAKSSCSNPASQQDFVKNIEEIRTKLTNTFLLAVAIQLQRHATTKSELPTLFKTLDLKSLNFLFVLVINSHKEEWLAPVKDALDQALKSVLQTWSLPPTSVVVLNHELAKKYKLTT